MGFAAEYQAKYPKALVSFFDLPAEHWQHLPDPRLVRTKSLGGTVRHGRVRSVTKQGL
jgi:hypothetical protein